MLLGLAASCAGGAADERAAGSNGAAAGAAAVAGKAGSGGASGEANGGAGGAATAGQGGTAGADGGSAGAAGAGGAIALCELIDSEPVRASADGQVIENLHILASGTPGIEVDGFADVVIRNVWIEHGGDAGIVFAGADHLTIENAVIEHTGAPESGENDSDSLNNIDGHSSEAPVISRVRLKQGSSGIYLVQCPNSQLSFVEGYDFRGPFPRGQLVQWNDSDGGKLEDFSVVNPPGSWPEDNVNVYQTLGVEIRRGHIDGNNSPSGVGVIFDGGTSTGLVEDVDAIRMGNGCFSDYAGGEDVIFRRTGCRDNICESQGRGEPGSNGLMWAGNGDYTTLRVEDSHYFAACNPANIVWPAGSFELAETEEVDFEPRPPLALRFCWE
jgi:hypothetical protein